MAKRYRKKIATVEAIQWLNNGPEIIAWIGHDKAYFVPERNEIVISDPDGDMTVSPGDWVIKSSSVDDLYYPCDPGEFAATFEAVEVER